MGAGKTRTRRCLADLIKPQKDQDLVDFPDLPTKKYDDDDLQSHFLKIRLFPTLAEGAIGC